MSTPDGDFIALFLVREFDIENILFRYVLKTLNILYQGKKFET